MVDSAALDVPGRRGGVFSSGIVELTVLNVDARLTPLDRDHLKSCVSRSPWSVRSGDVLCRVSNLGLSSMVEPDTVVSDE